MQFKHTATHNEQRTSLRALLSLFLAAFLALLPGCGTDNASTSFTDDSLERSPSAVQLESNIPTYSGSLTVAISNNEPSFTDEEIAYAKKGAFEVYLPLDSLGRATGAIACAGLETMPTEERESISSVHPTGWHSSKYSWIDGESLYNRCHLIGFLLTAENANERNLITGTRAMNAEAMLPYEEGIARYIEKTENHVLYRVTPVYSGNDLVARGVLMEARSVEDDGSGVNFCVYCFNVQPGVEIDYETGDNWDSNGEESLEADASDVISGSFANEGTSTNTSANNASGSIHSANSSNNSKGNSASSASSDSMASDMSQYDYVLNTNSMKVHETWCDAVAEMSATNRKGFNGTLDEAEALGFIPCGRCM